MSRFSLRRDEGTGYHRGSLEARNEAARALRAMLEDAGHFMSDMDRFAGWWPGRTGRITGDVPTGEQVPSGTTRYHLTLEDVIEIGRFLEMDASATLEVLAATLAEREEGRGGK